MEKGELTLFVSSKEWLKALPIGEALKLRSDDVRGVLFDALFAASDCAGHSNNIILQLVLRNTFRHTLEHYYFSPEGNSLLLAVLRACHHKTDTASTEYFFYDKGGIPAATALFIEAAADPSISDRINKLSEAEKEDLVKYICHRPRNVSFDLWVKNKLHLLKSKNGYSLASL